MGTLSVMGENREIKYLKNFNNIDKIIQKIENDQKQNIVSSGIWKRQKQDHNISKGDFHTTVVKPFYSGIDTRNKGCI